MKSLSMITVAAVLVFATSAAAQSDATSAVPFSRGQTELGVLAGGGFAMDIWGGLPDSDFVTLGLRLGRVMTGPIGPGLLRGNFLVGGEFYPVILFREAQRTTYALSGALVFRHYFAPASKIRPFLSAGGGAVWSARPIPREISRVNFTPQGGAGLAIGLTPGALFSVEYRIHHMSDAQLTDYNPGANSNEFQISISWVR
jgi:lipid A 3-O-deacylase